jgi:hypothetical protein
MFKKFVNSKGLCILFFVCAITSFVIMGGGMTSCEVGLGASVDTQPPTVDVQVPSADFIVRDIFTMKGNCSDEQGLQSITVTLRNSQTGEFYPKTETPYEAKINKEQTEWECVVDPFAEGNKIPDGSYEANNFTELQGTSMWSDTANSDPITDVMNAQDAVEAETGTRPSILLVSKKTMNWLKQNVKVREYTLAQNVTANIIMTDNRVRETFSTELGVTIIVYSKQYKDETGTVKKFYPDGMATLIPDKALGNTWYGMTPEERTLVGRPDSDVAIVDGGVAVSVTLTEDPVWTKTTVSEIVLPSFEAMSETYTLKVGAVAY